MTDHVIETVTFELNREVDAEDFLRAAHDMKTFLDECPGFVSRRLAQAEDGSWLEHIEWRDMTSAKAAAAAIGTREDLRPFLSAIRGDSVKLSHSTIRLAVN